MHNSITATFSALSAIPGKKIEVKKLKIAYDFNE